MKTAIALILVMSMNGALALADDNAATPTTSTIKKSDVQNSNETVSGDLDNEITNAKLRAESGSKSRWSGQFNLTYNGGNVITPFSDTRPNYTGAAAQDTATNVQGTVAIAYRLSEHDALRAGTGVYYGTPFQNDLRDAGNGGGDGRKTDASNPYLDYGRSFRIGNVQNAFDTSFTNYTQNLYSNELQMVGTYDINHTFMWEFEGSGWSPGINVDANYTFFKDTASAPGFADESARANDPNVIGRYDLEVAVFPMVEYAFNDRYSFRTVFRFWTFDHYRSDAAGTFYREMYSQSVGVGIAATRDIYLYPNLQFAPEQLRPSATNVALTATINVF